MSDVEGVLEFRILGPLEARREGEPIALGAPKQRALLALLILRAGEVVSTDRLIDDLWGEAAPAGATHTLHVFVSRLRKALGSDALVTRSPGYLLDLPRGMIDAERFRRLVADADDELSSERPDAAAERFECAFELWRGPALADFAYEPWAREAAEMLEEVRLGALERWNDARLALGRHRDLVGELEQLAAEHPLRERFRGQLMMALYRSGRQAEALEQYAQARESLLDELGIDPSPELQALHRQVLNQDASLAAPPSRPSAPRHNLPAAPNQLIGRERELEELRNLLTQSDARLVTLTGPGGMGKTRLALQVGAEALDRFPGGVFFCDLAPLRNSDLLASTIARALGAREQPGETSEQSVTAYVADKRLMLILDNFEHLLESSPLVARLLAACPNLCALATSRAPLRLSGEREFPVDSLALPGAAELFVERVAALGQHARDQAPERATVEAICERLDRLPLALELASARVRSLTLDQLLARLEQALPVLTGGRRDAPDRQRTLRATLDWSYELLDPGEQQALARVAVFAGGFSAEAAEVVCEATLDEIGVLIEHNLLRRREARLTLLETIREYGLERLAERGDERDLRRQHADWFLNLAGHAAEELYGAKQVACLDRLESELDNLRVALAFLLEASDANGALCLTSSLWVFWEARRAAEGRRMLEASLERRAGAEPHLLARALFAIGQLTYFEGNVTRAATFLEEAAQLSRETGDDPWLAVSLSRLSWVALDTGRTEDALRLAIEALAVLDRVTEPWAQAETLNFAGATLAECGEGSRGLRLLKQSRATYQSLGNEQRAADVLNNLGWASMLDGDLVAAREYHRSNLEVARRIRDGLRLGLALGNLGVIETLAGDLESARPLMHESLISLRDRGERRTLPEAFIVAAAVLAKRGDCDEAGRLVGSIEAMIEADGRGYHMIERRILDEHILTRVASGGSETFERARAQGRELTLSDTIARALAALGD